MSNQGKAYRLTDEQRGALWVHADSLGRRFPNEAPEQVFWQETAAAISHPVPTAQEMWDRIQALYQGKYFMYPSFEGGFRALNEAAAEMGLTIDEEQGDA